MDNSTGQILQVQSLENGNGLQFLINKAYEILGNPLVLHNMEYELIACTENISTDDWLWNEIVETGVFSSESIKFFREECFIDIVACTQSAALLKSDKLKYDRLYGRVVNNYGNTVADLVMVACDKPLSVPDTTVFESVCRKLSQEISENTFYKNYGVLYNEKLICELLDADIGDKITYSGHVSNLYEGLKTNLYIAVADIGKCDARKNDLEEFRNLFKEMQPEFKYAVYSKHIVIIASSDKKTLSVKRDLHKLSGYFNANNIRVGFSSRFENLYNLREYYNEAIGSLKRGLEEGRRTADQNL